MSSTPPLAPRPLERSAELAPGRVLGDRFEIRERIGEGALGAVYRAYDREIEVEVALKTLRDDVLTTPEERSRFLEVAAQLCKLYHPNFVRLFRAAQDGPIVYLAMQLLQGLTLREVMNRRQEQGTPFSIEEVEPFISQIAAALADGHKLSAHGDLRPENVVILPNLVKVTDFGIAALVSGPAFLAATQARGGEGYLAPEVRAGGEHTVLSDVYSLGAIAAELFTGEVPGPAFRLRDKRPDLPDTLEALIGNSLADDPSVRISDPSHLARGVRGHVADQSALSVASRTRSVVRPTQLGTSSREVSQAAANPSALAGAAAASAAPSPTGRFVATARPEGVGRPESNTPPRGSPGPGANPPPPPPLSLRNSGSQSTPLPFASPAAMQQERAQQERAQQDRAQQDRAQQERAQQERAQQDSMRPKAVAPTSDAPANAVLVKDPLLKDPQPNAAPASPAPHSSEFPPYEREAGVGGERTTVLPPESAILAAAGARSADRRPIPLPVWILVILLLVGGATYGAILYIESNQKEQEAALVAEQERERADIAQKRDVIRKDREEAEKKASAEALLAKQKAEEAAKLAANDPAKKAEADRLAAEAKKKEDERLALEKKRTEDEKKEAEDDEKREKAQAKKDAKKKPEKKRETVAVTPVPVAPTPETAQPEPVKPEPVKPEPIKPEPVKPEPVKVDDPTPKPELVASATPLAPEKKKGCPDGMARIKAGGFRMGSADDDPMRNFSEKRLARVKTDEYCIDRFEFPNRRGSRPRAGISWDSAKSACEGAGKRLCNEAEWERACKGFGGLRFPYGDDFDDEKCNTETKAGEKRSITAAGAFAGCKSGFGVFDMSGNVAEWTATPLSAGSRAMIIKGGAANKPDWAVRCANRGNKPAGSSDGFLGFRCCANPE